MINNIDIDNIRIMLLRVMNLFFIRLNENCNNKSMVWLK